MPKKKNKIKIPTMVGLQEARRKLKKMKKKQPSGELVEIIKEVTGFDEKLDHIKYDIAARPLSNEVEQ